jgi:hypothetical protein
MEQDRVKIETQRSAAVANEIYRDSFQYKFSLKPIFSIAGVRKDSPAYEAGLKKMIRSSASMEKELPI